MKAKTKELLKFDRVWVGATVGLKVCARDGVTDIARPDGAVVVEVGVEVERIAEDVGVNDESVGVMVT